MSRPNAQPYRTNIQHGTSTEVQHGPLRAPSGVFSTDTEGRLEPEIWDDATDPAMVLDVERGAAVEDLDPRSFVP